MLKRHSEILLTTLLIGDLLLVAGSWLAAYVLRFETGLPVPRGIPPFESYLPPLLVILPLWLWLFRSRGLYEPRRTEGLLPEVGAIAAASAVGLVLLVAISFFARSYYYSRGVMLLFFGLTVVSVSTYRLALRSALRSLRRRGYNLRDVVLVGSGRLAEEIVERVRSHAEAGLRLVGVLTDDPTARHILGVPVIGAYSDLKPVLRSRRPDQVILALPRHEPGQLEKVLAELDDETVSVCLIPDLMHVLTVRSSVGDFDGLPVIALRETPLVGWAAVQKRTFDLAVSAMGLLLAAPLLAVIALAIRATSGSPVLFVQERMGLDGRVFRMLKFRTMHVDAERETGPVWARPGDPRRTRLGRLLRRTSLDELPQLWNVLRGDMSLVGPRPERPAFIARFRQEIPGYMLRHKVKAGCTGWAQVHGWRGDTSLHERIEHDLYYIQNWSLGLDVRILLMTVLRRDASRNAC